MDAGMIGAEP